MPELLTYTSSDFADLASLMKELSSNIVFTCDSLDSMLADPNSHLYVIREEGRIVACASLCIFHQPFSTDATIESVVVTSKMRGKGLGRKLMEHLIDIFFVIPDVNRDFFYYNCFQNWKLFTIFVLNRIPQYYETEI